MHNLELAAVLAARMSPQALQSGSAAGLSLALAWRFLQNLEPVVPPPLEVLCPEPLTSGWHLPSLFLGIVLGLCLGPCLEALVAARALIYQTVWTASAAESRPYYKLC